MKSFNNILVDMRKNRGLTQKALSEKIGVTEQAVSKWERGKSFPSYDIIQSMIYILDSTPNEFFGFEEDGTKTFDVNKPDNLAKAEKGILPDPITLEFGMEIIELFANKSYRGLESIHDIRVTMSFKYGIILPVVRVRDNIDLEDNQYRILFGTKVMATDYVYPDKKWSNTLDAIEGDIRAREPVFGLDIVWTNRDIDGLKTPVSIMTTHLEHLVVNHFDQFISLKYVYDTVEIINRHNPIIRESIVPERVSYQVIKKVLAALVVKNRKRINEMTYIIERIDEELDKGVSIDALVIKLSEELPNIE